MVYLFCIENLTKFNFGINSPVLINLPKPRPTYRQIIYNAFYKKSIWCVRKWITIKPIQMQRKLKFQNFMLFTNMCQKRFFFLHKFHTYCPNSTKLSDQGRLPKPLLIYYSWLFRVRRYLFIPTVSTCPCIN